MNEVVPFGKYKGQPIELLAADPQYCDWLASQDWFRERYSKIYTVIINNFAQPEDTPEHNKMQARFLDDDFVRAVVFTFGYGCPKDVGKTKVAFERNGFDVFVSADYLYNIDGEIHDSRIFLNIELKPTIGDDYPTVMRQISANRKRAGGDLCCLIYDGFSGSGITESQMRKMFEMNNILISSVWEIEEQMKKGESNGN